MVEVRALTDEQHVYLVRHATLGSLHLLELPRPDLAERMLARGRIQAAVRHANVVAITDLLEGGEVTALVREYVDGPTLNDWIADLHRADDVRMLLDVFRRVVAAVHAVHRAGIVLGNLSAENILVGTIEGHPVPKVTAIGCDPAEVELGVYQAPEQLDDPTSADPRSDLWALGALLYHLLTRRLPFDSEPFEPLERLRPEVPHTIVHIVRGLLEFDPADRTQTVEALVAELSPEPRTPTVPMRVLDLGPRTTPGAILRSAVPPTHSTAQAFRRGAAIGLGVFLLAVLAILGSMRAPEALPVEEEARPAPTPTPVPALVEPVPVDPIAPVEPATDPAVVSGADYAVWLRSNPQWSRDEARRTGLANNRYLRRWKPDPPPGPVVQLPWTAAQAFCADRGGLLGLDEPPLTWEPGLEQEWRDRDGRPATRRFDGVTSDADPGDEAFSSTGVRCRR